jgi:hypothetical protein
MVMGVHSHLENLSAKLPPYSFAVFKLLSANRAPRGTDMRDFVNKTEPRHKRFFGRI